MYDIDCSPDSSLLRFVRRLDLSEFSPIPVVHFEVSQKRLLKFDCLANNTLVPLVNERLKNLLEQVAPNEVKFFPAKAMCSDGELEGYYFLNITTEIVGIDKEKSIYTHMKTIDPVTRKDIVLDAISGFII